MKPQFFFAFAVFFTTGLAVFSQESSKSVSIFDGKTLSGWDFEPDFWRVENGVITGGSTTEKIKGNHFISTKKSYQNFDLKLKIKCSGDPKTGMINSGIQIRSVRVPGGHHMSGYQVDCGKGWFGKIYDEFRRNKVIAGPIDAAAVDKVVDVYGWNEYRILAEGPRIQVWINGVPAIDYTEKDPNVALDGQIAPQVHSGGMCLVEVKDVTIKELPATANAPTWQSLGGAVKAIKQVKPTKKPKAAPKKTAKNPALYNSLKGEAKTAAEQQKLFHLPKGYEIELVVQESAGVGKFISVYFDQRGRMWTQTAFEYPVDANENAAAAEALYQGKGKDKVLVYPREALNQALPPGGLSKPVVFADGLAIPLGILPWGNGDSCYTLHGHDLLLLKDSDGDGKSDQREVILTGFGIQDSHLFPHQFTRAPGGWMWMAQGLFNNSEVRRPGGKQTIPFPKCSMARMRLDGSEFEVTSTGPNNIWGLVMTGEGETFIQEANDYGYSVMEFHDYAYYPGGMKAFRKSYQPEFPPNNLRMGGTGLSGLALVENGPGVKSDAGLTMLIANPITSKINTIAMKRNGSYWEVDQLPDFVTCDDPFFRPVGMTQGPDGCIYIVDWYNKIISHNEVARNHPDRDKTRGRIWRIKPSDDKGIHEIPDFTELSSDKLLSMLGTVPTARAHMAWQTLVDRQDDKMLAPLKAVISGTEANDARRIQALWILSESERKAARSLAKSENRNVRRELARYPELVDALLEDSDREVRFAAIQTLARQLPERAEFVLPEMLAFAKPSLKKPSMPSARTGQDIPIREAYDREFERFLVRMFLERNQQSVLTFLDSEAAKNIPSEALMLATLALDPKTSASRVAALLPTIGRAPNAEEIMRLAQFPKAVGSGEAIKALLASPDSSASVVEVLLAQRTSFDPKKVGPFLVPAAKAMLEGQQVGQAAQLVGAFQLSALEPNLIKLLGGSASSNEDKLAAVKALRQLQSAEVDLLAALVAAPTTAEIGREALAALAESKSPQAGARIIAMFPKLNGSQRRDVLAKLSAKKAGAEMLVAAFLDGRLPKKELDGPTAERLSSVLHDSPGLATLMESMSDIFHDILLLDGSADAWAQSGITLEGPFTIETWVRLAPGIGNQDGILGAKNVIDLNFYASTFRFWVGGGVGDVAVSKKPVTPGLWTHIAVTRDASGQINIYSNGELDAPGRKKASGKFENLNVGWTGPKKGTHGALAEFRVWNVERSARQIRQNFDRSFADGPRPEALTFYNSGGDSSWGKLGKGAHVAKTVDAPPLLTAEQSRALDAKFAKYIKLAEQGGDIEKGKALSALCTACHVIKGTGGQIGPELSGAGAMGLEGVLRNILTPNAAMEAGYRIFRVELKNGDILDAFYVSENKGAIVVRQPGGADMRLAKKDIRSTRYIRRSLMPEGLLDALSDEMAADLLAYLMTLK